jgi:uncharacterized Zn-binding protein involved in type VI secretion
MRGVIRLHDTTTHGGKVISATANSVVMGLSVARVGDLCMCPIPGHQMCVIAQGDPKVSIDGMPVAFEGHLTSCGAQLISSISTSGIF